MRFSLMSLLATRMRCRLVLVFLLICLLWIMPSLVMAAAGVAGTHEEKAQSSARSEDKPRLVVQTGHETWSTQ